MRRKEKKGSKRASNRAEDWSESCPPREMEEAGADGDGMEEGEEEVVVVAGAWARVAAGKKDRERRTVRPKESGRASERARGRVTGRE
jgi:hypothetical protein